MQQRAAPPLVARLAAIAATVATLAGCAPAGTRSDAAAARVPSSCCGAATTATTPR